MKSAALIHHSQTLVPGWILLLVDASDGPGNTCLLVPGPLVHTFPLPYISSTLEAGLNRMPCLPDLELFWSLLSFAFLSWTLNNLQDPTRFGSKASTPNSSPIILLLGSVRVSYIFLLSFLLLEHVKLIINSGLIDCVTISGMLISLIFTSFQPKCHPSSGLPWLCPLNSYLVNIFPFFDLIFLSNSTHCLKLPCGFVYVFIVCLDSLSPPPHFHTRI